MATLIGTQLSDIVMLIIIIGNSQKITVIIKYCRYKHILIFIIIG